MATDGSSLSSLIERMQMSVKVRPDLWTNLCEEVEQWVVEAKGIQGELRTALQEVKEAKEWLGSLVFTVNPVFLGVEMNPVHGPTVLQCPLKEPEFSLANPSNLNFGEDSAPVIEPTAVSRELPQPSDTVQPVRMKQQPMFLSSEEEGEDTPTPKKARTEKGP
ncbi:hypothetical protein JB92DRAFT_3133791 [Gautieria morchelliformis]|nr:hypothetical protein JB92DRAFT_3133791 [Gautieria morchelliformis]